MSDLATSDARARERALDVGVSFIVQAPAGSGKTTVLTQRYLKLLTTVNDPEQVLAITFTRKAAGEMRERVQRALEGDLEVRSPSDALTLELAAAVRAHATRRGWGLEDSAARLRIQTIDSFNGFLASSLPVTSRNGLGRSIADQPDDLYLLAARETLRTAEADEEFRLAFELILRRLDDSWGRLERLIADMLPRRAEWLPNLPQLSGEALVPQVEASLAVIVTEELARASAMLPREFVELAGEVARLAAPNLAGEEWADVIRWREQSSALGQGLADLGRWRGITRLALTGQGTPRKVLNKSQGILSDDPRAKMLRDSWIELLATLDAGQLAALTVIAELPEPRMPEDARRALDALARLLLLAAQELTLQFDAYGECDHTEIAGAARHALTAQSSPTPLAERLGTRLMHILVDEFQDTSRDQYELLRTLTQDWSGGDGRTLFVVGDPMQSIYGFRNAEVGRFATVRDGGLSHLPLEPLELRRNFRSAPALVQWCNDIFARVFPPDDDLRSSAVRHLASVAARENVDGRVCLYRVETAGPRAEAEEVARQIETLRARRPGETVAVLAGARPHLRAVRNALAQRQVPFIGVNLEPLADVAVVRDLEALVRALDAPLDRVAWLAVLRAPFVGLSLPDLTVVSEAAGVAPVLAALRENFPGLSADGMQRLMRARAVLAAAWHERDRETRAQRVERVWLTLGGAATCNAAELGHARRFLAALDEEEHRRLRGRSLDLTRLMDGLYAQDPAQPGAVQLMTIHGAKGLEFDHVFVVGAGRRGRGDDARLLNWLEIPRARGADHLLMAPIRVRDDDADEESDQINAYLRRLHRARARAERARQAYVALTRAKHSLHLFVHPRVRDQDGERAYAATANTLLENLWPALGGDIGTFNAVGQTEAETPPGPVTQSRRRLPRGFAVGGAPPDVQARGELVPVSADEDAIEFSWARQTARRVGTVVHEALERFSRGTLPAAAELLALRARLESRLQALGVEGEAALAGAERALTALRTTLEDVRGRWLFDPTHREAGSELALTGVRGGRIINAVIDRTFVSTDGVRWVIDFKTSPHEGAEVQSFLDEEVKRYQPQLQRYAHLARELGPEPVRAGLYYPLLAAWREVDLE
jgi:ATP-dependent helicase/nuclease subunit A